VAGTADLLGHDEIGTFQDPDMLLDPVDRQLVRPRQVADRCRTVAEALEDPTSRRIRERKERAVECRWCTDRCTLTCRGCCARAPVVAPVVVWHLGVELGSVGAAGSAAGVGECAVFAGAVVADGVNPDEFLADADLDGPSTIATWTWRRRNLLPTG
jgi:hypothetical protein